MHHSLSSAVLSFGLVLVTAAAQVPCDTWLSTGSFPGANGEVWATAVRDPDGPGPAQPRLVVAGNFTLIDSIQANRIAEFDPATGTWTALGGGLNGAVRALAVMPNGDLVAGGSFFGPSGLVARWNGNAWTALGSGLYGPPFGSAGDSVQALAVAPNGDLVASGHFALGWTWSLAFVARWNGTSWFALGPDIGVARTVAVRTNGEVVAGGLFQIVGFVNANRVVSWSGTSWVPMGASLNSSVLSLAVQPNGDLIAGGLFTQAGSTSVGGIAQWNGSSWAPIGSASFPDVSCVAIHPNGDILAGGGDGVARWNGLTWSPVGPVALGGIGAVSTCVAMPLGDMFAGGFRVVAGVTSGFLARWDGSVWQRFGTGPNDTIRSIASMPNGDLVVGGVFREVGGVPFGAIARWSGGTWAPMGAGMATGPGLMNPSVDELVTLPNGDLVAGGYFTTAGGVPVNSIARWNGTTWLPLGSGVLSNFGSVGVVSDMALRPNGDLVVVGSFDNAGGVAAGGVALWNSSGWSTLGSGAWLGNARDVAVAPNGDIYVAGIPSYDSVARWSGNAWVSLGVFQYQYGATAVVEAIASLPNGHIVVAGAITTIGGIAVNGFAVWDGSAWAAFGSGLNGGAYSVATLANGDLVAGGWFGYPFLSTARWNGTSWMPLDSGANDDVRVVAPLPNGDLAIGGRFTVAGNVVSPKVAIFHFCLPSYAPLGPGCPGALGVPGNELVAAPRIGSTLTNRLTRLPANVAFHLIGWSATSFSGGPLPYDLAALGMPGCQLRISKDLCDVVVGSGNTATWSAAIPNAPAWLGATFYSQAVVPDSGANALGFTVSDAAVVVVGN